MEKRQRDRNTRKIEFRGVIDGLMDHHLELAGLDFSAGSYGA